MATLKRIKKYVAAFGAALVALTLVLTLVIAPHQPATAAGTVPAGTDYVISQGGSLWTAYEAAGFQSGSGFDWAAFKVEVTKASCAAAEIEKKYNCPTKGLFEGGLLRIPPAPPAAPVVPLAPPDISGCAKSSGELYVVTAGDGLSLLMQRIFEDNVTAQGYYPALLGDTNALRGQCPDLAAKAMEKGKIAKPEALKVDQYVFLSDDSYVEIEAILAELDAKKEAAAAAAVAKAAVTSAVVENVTFSKGVTGTWAIVGGGTGTYTVTKVLSDTMVVVVNKLDGTLYFTMSMTNTLSAAPTPTPTPVAAGTRGLAAAPACTANPIVKGTGWDVNKNCLAAGVAYGFYFDGTLYVVSDVDGASVEFGGKKFEGKKDGSKWVVPVTGSEGPWVLIVKSPTGNEKWTIEQGKIPVREPSGA